MNDFYIENKRLTGGKSLSWHLAHHLETKQGEGKVIIVTLNSDALCSAVSRQWRELVRQVARDRSRTLSSDRIKILTEQLGKMQKFRFTSKAPQVAPHADVFFAPAKVFENPPVIWHTVYLLYTPPQREIDLILRAIPSGGYLIKYEGL